MKRYILFGRFHDGSEEEAKGWGLVWNPKHYGVFDSREDAEEEATTIDQRHGPDLEVVVVEVELPE